jgi:hypothetical protein
MKKAIFLLLSMGVLLSCGNKKPFVKPYYFPYTDFFTPKVYKYVNAKDTSQVQYWRFETGAKNGDTMLTTGIYDSHLRLLTVYHNKITDEGSRLQLMFINPGDSNTLFPCEVKQNESFNWEVKPATPIFLSFSMKNATGQSTEIVSERNFQPKKETLSFKNETYECVVVKESTMINRISNNRTRSEEQQRTSYFAKGVGLIQYETFYANGKNELFSLDEIIVDKDKDMFVPEVKDSTSSVQ